MRRVLCGVVLIVPVAASCGVESSDAATSTAVRDSAGIEIVENSRPGWDAADAWRLADTPALSMGGTEGDSAHEFFRVRGTVRLSDGTIVVANGGTQQLRYYGPDGTLLRAVGRKGGGPGEFQALMGMFRAAGDTLLAHDLMNRRVSLFDPSGRHVRDVSIAGPTPFSIVQIAGRFRDGSYLGYVQTGMGPDMLNRPQGPARDSIQVLRLDSAGSVTDTVGVFPSGRVEVHSIEMMGRAFPMPVPVPFSPSTTVEMGPDLAYVGTNETYEIAVRQPDGALRRLIRRSHEPRAVTEADKERYRTLMTRAIERQPNSPLVTQMRDAMAKVPYPDVMPAYGRLVVDAGDNVWAAEFFIDQTEPTVWTVFDREGRWLGTVTTPARLHVREIGPDYVLGQMEDEMEVERILLYRLIKPVP